MKALQRKVEIYIKKALKLMLLRRKSLIKDNASIQLAMRS
jgi:hypothetical protein